MTPVLALTTVGTSEDARRIADDLVERRLCACVNILGGVQSVYWWQGKVSREPEQLLLIKTVQERLEDLRRHLMSVHPYEVPEFVVLRIDDISPAYKDWLVASLRGVE